MPRSSRTAPPPEETSSLWSSLAPETKQSVVAVVFFVLASLFLLSFFGVAGTVGEGIEYLLTHIFGWDRFLVPLLLFVIGGTCLFPEHNPLSRWNYIGFGLFFLCFNALLNVLLTQQQGPSGVEGIDVTLAGGWIGLSAPLTYGVGFWGAIIVLSSGLLIAVVLAFNTSLRQVVGVHTHLTGWFGEKMHHHSSSPIEEIEEEVVEEVVEEEGEELEEEPEEETAPVPIKKERLVRSAPVEEDEVEETVLTTKKRRMVSIPMDLLDHRIGKANAGDVDKNREIIERTLRQFGVDVEMADTATGPTLTQYSLRPAQGVKLAKIVNLQNDLALALAAHPIRIEAPIPGKSLVGVEVPNQKIATVCLRELLESKEFAERKTPLSIPLGKDVSGTVSVIAIEKMPHLLVAGATGSGKSVCINTIIVSLLYQNGPDDLKLILVDPKRVELVAYEGIPHLLTPPILKTEDTINALKWTVREMERRLDVLSKFGARDITSYNERSEEKMPKIVVIIDELADLMTTSGREVETSIIRIAQLARAVGIHLILATQRPSVDVITGIMKANVPGRIAFSVASQMDSRTILDLSGAEKLLGRGDMLFISAELSKPKRLQGAFISEEEVARVVSFLKEKGAPDYNYAITEAPRSTSIVEGGGGDDPLLAEATRVVVESGKASTSLLQRRLKIGYSRAARIIDLLEEQGVIGPGDGAKPREVLLDRFEQEEDVAGDEADEEVEETEEADVEEEGEEIEEEEDETQDASLSRNSQPPSPHLPF